MVHHIRDLKPFEQDDTVFVERGRQVGSETGRAALVRETGVQFVSKMQFDRVVGAADY